MRPRYLLATIAAAFALSATSAQAAPKMPDADIGADTGVVLVHDYCHDTWRTHGGYYPRHYHGRRCRMITEEAYDPPRRWDRDRYRNYRHDDSCVTLGTPAFGFKLCD